MALLFVQDDFSVPSDLIKPVSACVGHLPQRSAQLWTLAVSSFPSEATLLSVQAEDEAGGGTMDS